MTSTDVAIRPVRQRWAMPVSLQPRAALCDVVDASSKRPVRRSPLGFHVRPRRRYQIVVLPPQGDLAPESVRLAATGALRHETASVQTTHDGQTLHWLDFEPVREAGWPWQVRSLFSRCETMGVRLHYRDGRDDCEHNVPLVITPSRAWVLCSLCLIVLYFLFSRLTETLFSPANNAPFNDDIWRAVRNPTPWLTLAAVIAALWLAVTLGDRIYLAHYWRQRRHAQRE